MSDFSSIAPRYLELSTLQRAASERLFDLLAVGPHDDVLDLGCGTGHLTARLRTLTDGRVVGMDPSPVMIEEARRDAPPGVDFRVGGAASLGGSPGLARSFDAIFCNSVFHWFAEPVSDLAACRAALRPGGRMAAQAPATQRYCPNFTSAVGELLADPATRRAFATWRSPWYLRETAEAYESDFLAAGFASPKARLQRMDYRRSPAEVMDMFESGASAGYLNPAYYAEPPDAEYFAAARRVIAAAFAAQAGPDGLIDLVVRRVYVVASRPAEA